MTKRIPVVEDQEGLRGALRGVLELVCDEGR
jgi:hypothetical protein